MSKSYYGYWSILISKMPCGRIYMVPKLGNVYSYKKSNSRKFGIASSKKVIYDLSIDDVRNNLLQISTNN